MYTYYDEFKYWIPNTKEYQAILDAKKLEEEKKTEKASYSGSLVDSLSLAILFIEVGKADGIDLLQCTEFISLLRDYGIYDFVVDLVNEGVSYIGLKSYCDNLVDSGRYTGGKIDSLSFNRDGCAICFDNGLSLGKISYFRDNGTLEGFSE